MERAAGVAGEKRSSSHSLRNADSQEGQIYQYHESKALRRKIDLLLLPFLCLIYFAQYLDKTLLNYASVMGLRTDTHLTTQEYANLGTIFYVRTRTVRHELKTNE